MQDGWQTSKHAKKAVKWDYYAQLKMKLIQQIDNLICQCSIEEGGEIMKDGEWHCMTCMKQISR